MIRKMEQGQGLVETALFLPIVLIILSAVVELGYLANFYLSIQDAARNAARFSSDGLYYAQDNIHDCATTRDFYRQTACLVIMELSREQPGVVLDFGNGIDDIIVSSFSVVSGPTPSISARHPLDMGELGWSASLDWTNSRNQQSFFTSLDLIPRLDPGAPSTGIVMVEIIYAYDQIMKLPWITAFLDDPVVLHTYSIMPLVSAEPTSTPIP
jgi:hypothetical protein